MNALSKIDFNQPPHIIQREILKLPFEEQQYWIDLWLKRPEIQADLEDKRIKAMQHPEPINYKQVPPDHHWQD